MESSESSLQTSKSSATVQVALRIRPQGQRELLAGNKICTSVFPNAPQVSIGSDDRSFTYDYVFDQPSTQPSIYEACIENLVNGLFDGYNATVLAYGQTGSGKTYTMGTAFDVIPNMDEDQVGLIPRAIAHVFRMIMDSKRTAQERGILEPTFDVSVQFIELYNEEVIDLLAEGGSSSANIRIHEDSQGEIYLHGATARTVQDLHSTVETLKSGAMNRTVGSTNMNEQSSRSHAIFTLFVKQQRVVPLPEGQESATGGVEMEMLAAKFHFVDLAGSERLKRTGATGDRAREGININCGLLALGNVISALGGASGKVSHVPYRDSKLTRLLQDSLGGNSRTLMIACVSPSDSDFIETLNTMKYANRAKNIKNKVVANQDKSSRMIGELRGKIASLESELLEWKQGRRTVDGSGRETVNDQYNENIMLTSEVNQMRFRIKGLQEANEALRTRNVHLMARAELAGMAETANSNGPENSESDEVGAVEDMVRKYMEEMETLRSSLFEAQATSDQLRKEMQRWKAQAALANGVSVTPTALGSDSSPFRPNAFGQSALIEEVKANIERQKREAAAAAAGQGGTQNAAGEATSDYVSNTPSVVGETGEEDGTSTDADDLDYEEEEPMSEDDDDYEQENGLDDTQESLALRENLNDVQNDIGLKERLIEELERSERYVNEMRQKYEQRMAEVERRMRVAETEKNQKMAENTARKTTDKAAQEAVKRVREEYEAKMAEFQKELRVLKSMDKQHQRALQKQEKERERMMVLKGEVAELKKGRVELMKKIKEEQKKAQQLKMANAKQLAAREKEVRMKDNKIRLLETKDRQREGLLKRNIEEADRLRKAEKERARQARTRPSPVSRPGMGAGRQSAQRTPLRRGQPPAALIFSPKNAKLKWNMIEKRLDRLILQKQTMDKVGEQLSRFVDERHRLTTEISQLEKRFLATQKIEVRDELNEEMDSVRQKLKFVQDQITEAQTVIVDLDENKENGNDSVEGLEDINVREILNNCSNIEEAKYLISHLFTQCLERGVAAANSVATNRELEARIQQLEQTSLINQQLLTGVIDEQNLASDLDGILDKLDGKKSRSPSLQSLRAASTSPSQADPNEPVVQPYRARRRTATTEELLYVGSETAEEAETRKEQEKKEKRKLVPLPRAAAATHPPAFSRQNRQRQTIGGTSPATKLTEDAKKTPLFRQKSMGAVKGLPRVQSTPRLPAVVEGGEEPATTVAVPVATKTAKRPPRVSSIIKRLVPESDRLDPDATFLQNRKQGRIISVKSSSPSTTRVVTRSHTLEGHTKGVLAVDATNDFLLTGSKDRTAKLWDLTKGQEVRTFGVHPNNVNSVQFIPNSHLAITVSTYQVRVWDTREDGCIRILQSSGQVDTGPFEPVNSRSNQIPFLEAPINAARVDPSGRLIYTSFAGDVRIWNVDKWACYGRLDGAAQNARSEVACIATAPSSSDSAIVFTGSREHTVKMYEVNPTGEGVHHSKVQFTPPHYDNVTCMVAHENHLYTSSKDMNIMIFSLKDYRRDHLELKAHTNFVQGMCMVGGEQRHPLLTSVCKEGTIKFWDVSSTSRMRLVEEINKAHPEAINEVCANSYMMFTASSDQTVGFWKLTSA